MNRLSLADLAAQLTWRDVKPPRKAQQLGPFILKHEPSIPAQFRELMGPELAFEESLRFEIERNWKLIRRYLQIYFVGKEKFKELESGKRRFGGVRTAAYVSAKEAGENLLAILEKEVKTRRFKINSKDVYVLPPSVLFAFAVANQSFGYIQAGCEFGRGAVSLKRQREWSKRKRRGDRQKVTNFKYANSKRNALIVSKYQMYERENLSRTRPRPRKKIIELVADAVRVSESTVKRVLRNLGN